MLPFLLLVVTVGHIAECCDGPSVYTPEAKQVEVEIAPAEFISIEKWDWTVDDPRNDSGDEKTRLRIPFDEGTVEWEGAEIPVIVRSKDSVLYLVGYDRETGRKLKDNLPRYSYFRQDGSKMLPIRSDEFTKELATQNMWLRDPKVLEAVLALDTGSPHFRSSCNADIWRQLLTGEVGKGVSVDKETLDRFAEKYKPVKLTAIKRDSDAEKKKDEE